jgi:methionine-rich copper-binding protein CopC
MLTPTFRAISRPLALFLAMLLGTAPAQAHARLVGCDPAPNSTVAAPMLIQLHFSEELARKFSSIRLTQSGGAAIAIMAMDAKDAKSLSIMPHATLAPGQYRITWIAVGTDDGHKTTGTYTFTVK